MRTKTATEAFERRRAWSLVQVGGLGILLACAVMWFLPAHAYAAGEAVTIPPGPFTDGQTITVSGTGFTGILATGLQIIECSDPGGTTANLPMDAASGCDGTSVSGNQINPSTTGTFSTQYPIELLNASNSSILCDATDECVLWVGEDYNGEFLSGPHAFSAPFEIGSTTTTTTTTSPTGTTTTTSTTTTSTTTTSTPPTTTTSTPTTTTSSPSDTTTTTVGSGTTTTTVVGNGTTTTQAVSTAGTGANSSGASPVSASSGQLAFTGAPPFLPWLAGFGFLMSAVGLLGRRLIRDGPV
ncbi:MAG TPA: hypothetical protein VII76_12460 [Acidimicrobiales bacterium]